MFSPAKFYAMPFSMSVDIYMKWKLDYLILVLHIQFFLDHVEFQVNQEDSHPINYTERLSKPLK